MDIGDREVVGAAVKLAQTYIEGNSYAWHSFNFVLYSIGIFVIAGTACMVYHNIVKPALEARNVRRD